MKVGFLSGKISYYIFFELGLKSLCIFEMQGSEIKKCEIGENPHIVFQYDDFDKFCERIGFHKAFPIDDINEFKKDVIQGVLNLL